MSRAKVPFSSRTKWSRINEVTPSPAREMELFGGDEDGPFVMANLLNFKPFAECPDGSDAHLSGQEAYGRYGVEVRKHVLLGRVQTLPAHERSQHIEGVEHVAPSASSPLFGVPSQSVSTLLQISTAPGWIAAFMSLQSVQPKPKQLRSQNPSRS